MFTPLLNALMPRWSACRIAGLELWLSVQAAYYQDSGLTSRALQTNDPVGGWLDTSGKSRHGIQSVSANRPTLQVGQLQGQPAVRPNNTSAFLQLPAPISLSGPFTIYAVGALSASCNWTPLGGNANYSALFIHSNGNVYVSRAVDAAVVSSLYTGSVGAIAARFRRDAANNCYFGASGMAEVTLGTLTGLLAPDGVGASPANGYWNGGSNQFNEVLLASRDLVTSGEDPQVRSYLQQLYGVTIP